jgi:hypothetical protein
MPYASRPMSIRRGAAAVTIALAVVIGASSAFASSSPNASLTPGVADSRVTQTDIASTICTRGYTATVRNVSTRTKHAVYVEYGVTQSAQRNYVIDHLVPLEVGGANDIKNLWSEPKADAKTKDKLEGQMHTAVCNGSLSLTAAQARFLTASAQTPATAPPATEPPATEPPAPPAPAPQVVHPGAFCAPEGDTGVTTAGTAMVCGPASDGRNRWHAA